MIKKLLWKIVVWCFPACFLCSFPVRRKKTNWIHVKTSTGVQKHRICKQCSASLAAAKERGYMPEIEVKVI